MEYFMIKNYFLIYMLFCTSTLAMQKYQDTEAESAKKVAPQISFHKAPGEKTAEQILAENRDNPEFMDILTWLKQERPGFVPSGYASHPFYPILVDAMQLADFELDTLEKFIHMFMETDMANEEAEHLIKLRRNSLMIKNLVGQVIDIMQKKVTIETFLTEYMTDRFKSIVEYQAELLCRKSSILDLSNVEKVDRASNADNPSSILLLDAFMRSYNTKNRIVRTLLYYLKDQQPAPLIKRLPEKLVNLIRLSTSLIPYLNKQTDNWIDYEQALSAGEGRNFLCNSALLNIDVKKMLIEAGIQNFPMSKIYKKLMDHQVPSFLLEEKEIEKKVIGSNLINDKKSKKKKKKVTELKTISDIDTAPVTQIEKAGVTVLDASVTATPATSSMQTQDLTSTPAPNTIVGNIAGAPLLKEKSNNTTEIAVVKLPLPAPASAASSSVSVGANRSTAQPVESFTKVGNTHVKTILDIFRPKGYTSLNDTKIIAAWEHVMEGRGYHKNKTGRSHQPLYAQLEDNSRVVLGLFRSSGYGPNYIKYIREAFDNIGFGRAWLNEQGYILDKNTSKWSP
jgi:hypothetical protein